MWEFKCKVIVMLCHLTEEGRESSYCYWPIEEGSAVSYGSISVTLESTQSFEAYKIRKFTVTKDKVGSCMLDRHCKTHAAHGLKLKTFLPSPPLPLPLTSPSPSLSHLFPPLLYPSPYFTFSFPLPPFPSPSFPLSLLHLLFPPPSLTSLSLHIMVGSYCASDEYTHFLLPYHSE